MAPITSLFSFALLTSILVAGSPVGFNRPTADDINSTNNTNIINPSQPVYPRKSARDAPFSVTERALRHAIYIPPDFEYGSGSKNPVIMIPGTAVPAGTTYANGFGRLLGDTDYADPVWVNIPGNSLGDVQVNSEYIAYAINYIAGVSRGKKVGLVSWSQGGINAQWAFKFWPSTINVVTDHIALAPDFKGSVLAPLICSPLTMSFCTPAIKQQDSTSNLIAALRSNGGDSAFVPTTTFYSSSDEIVQPQTGVNASAYLLDARNVGVTNNQVQVVCENPNAIVLHEGAIYNALAWGLIQDALTHDGPGQPSRLDTTTLCNEDAAPGMDALASEAAIGSSAVGNILAAPGTTLEEVPIASYAS
ncbi:hypothetical protein BDW59DRAFT_167815 [Aspergillus cavernicola]|uniref:Lipase B n=1 Tax=Aspergillus cavernicola TaxID=176166 RepID=A0ABR4HAF2_9EURO